MPKISLLYVDSVGNGEGKLCLKTSLSSGGLWPFSRARSHFIPCQTFYPLRESHFFWCTYCISKFTRGLSCLYEKRNAYSFRHIITQKSEIFFTLPVMWIKHCVAAYQVVWVVWSAIAPVDFQPDRMLLNSIFFADVVEDSHSEGALYITEEVQNFIKYFQNHIHEQVLVWLQVNSKACLCMWVGDRPTIK